MMHLTCAAYSWLILDQLYVFFIPLWNFALGYRSLPGFLEQFLDMQLWMYHLIEPSNNYKSITEQIA